MFCMRCLRVLRMPSKYTKGKTDTSTTAEMAMEIGAGVCQDHAHAFIAVARYLGLSARYVSGYLLMRDKKFKMLATHGQKFLPKVWAGWGLIFQMEFHQMTVMLSSLVVLTMLMWLHYQV